MRSLPAVLFAAVLFVACNGSASPTPPVPSALSSSPPASSVVADTEPPSTGEPTEPAPTDEPTPSAIVIETESPPPGDASPPASTGPGPAGDCSGSDENRDFFRAAASALDWTVYCAVLPAGWFVDSGQYRQAAGGWVQIAYRGPAGARFELHEGAFCAAADGCVPTGSDAGDSQFGDKTGTLVAIDDGGWAVVVDRAEKVSWLAVGTGLGEDAFRGFAATLVVVGG
jgi:hypothetical protein